MKNARLEAILEIIASEDIDTQEMLLDRLQARGFRATQATVSRDIRELKLVKSMTSKGNYRYTTGTKPTAMPLKFSSALTDSVIRIDVGGNILVVHTYPGMANAVAACLDSMKHEGVLGCVAGDDTILVVASDNETALRLSESIRHALNHL